MIFLKTNSVDPAFNLACEEYYLRDTELDVFMLWQNSPVVVIGKNQDIYNEIDFDYAEKNKISFIRRITGGGAVYHDLGNINFSFITSDTRAKSLDFEYFTAPIIGALKSMGLNASLSGRNDIIADDRKISGNAQYSSRGRILHHGTLLFDSRLDVLSKVLKPPIEKLESKKIRSVRSRVANVKELIGGDMSVGDFFAHLESFILSYFSCESAYCDEKAVRNSPYISKYTQSDFIFGRRKSYSFIKKRKYPFGSLGFCFDVEDGVITAFELEGDFFALKDTDPFAAAVVGCPFNEASLVELFGRIKCDSFFSGLDPKSLSEHILS